MRYLCCNLAKKIPSNHNENKGENIHRYEGKKVERERKKVKKRDREKTEI